MPWRRRPGASAASLAEYVAGVKKRRRSGGCARVKKRGSQAVGCLWSMSCLSESLQNQRPALVYLHAQAPPGPAAAADIPEKL